MGIRIKDAELVSEVTGAERIPVSDGSGQPKAVSTDQIKEYVIENAGDENVQSDWAETDPESDAYIKNKPVIPEEVTEQTIEDWGYTKNTGDYSKPSGGIPKSDLDKSVQESLGKADTALQSHQDISHLATKDELNKKQDVISDLEDIRSGAAKGATAIQQHQSLDGYVKDSELASVAKSGSYNDLSNKPTIPSAVTESTVSGWGFTKNQGTYVKPSSGIPLSDLNESVQTDIAKGAEAYGYLGNLNSALNGKQDKIADLDAIRSGAALGATALQEHQSLAGYTTEDYVMNAINESIIQTLNGQA